MNTFNKSAVAFLAASSIASVALADSGDYGRVVLEQAHVNSLKSQIEKLGGTAQVQEHTSFSV